MRFRFIEDRRADYPVTIMCDVLGVSPAGYYAWRARPESPRAAANRELVDDIKRVHRDTNGRYGSPRVHAELRAQGRGASRGRIERLMRRHGLDVIEAFFDPLADALTGGGDVRFFVLPAIVPPAGCQVRIASC